MILRLSLCSQWRGRVLLAAVVFLGAYWVTETARIALIETWSESKEVKDLDRARGLDPKNSEPYYRTGTLYFLGMNASSSDPLPWLRKATELNPRLGRYWLGLARACFVARDQGCADEALERAVKLSPMTPSTEWEAATYYALTGRSDKSFAHLRQLLHSAPERENQIFRFTWLAYD